MTESLIVPEKIKLSNIDVVNTYINDGTIKDDLNLEFNPENRKKHFKKSLSKFENYLRIVFSLTSKGYYTNRYGALGLTFGLLFGLTILSNFERSLSISLGLIGGIVVGSVIGRKKDAEAKANGNVL